jgi:hypothetical protein
LPLRCVFDAATAQFSFALQLDSHLQPGATAAKSRGVDTDRTNTSVDTETGNVIGTELSTALAFIARWSRRCLTTAKRELLILPASFQARRASLVPLRRRLEAVVESLGMLVRLERMLGSDAVVEAAWHMTVRPQGAAGGTH